MESNKRFKFLGEELLKFRKKKGFSQEELADKINVSRQSIHLWESGKMIPDIENIINLCNVLEISANQITKGFNVISTSGLKKNNQNKIMKIILVSILIFLMIYVVISLRKSFILVKLDNKISKFSDLSNYSYTESYYEMTGIKKENDYVKNVYYKDGIYKEEFFDTKGNSSTLIINRNEKIGYYFDNTNMIYRNVNVEEYVLPENKRIISVASPSRITKENTLINILYGFNPRFQIENKKETYRISFNTEINNLKIKTYEEVDKETGLVNVFYEYFSDGKYSVKSFEIRINETKSEDISLADMTKYSKVK